MTASQFGKTFFLTAAASPVFVLQYNLIFFFQFLETSHHIFKKAKQYTFFICFVLKMELHFHIGLGVILVLNLVLVSNATIAPPDKNKKTKAVKEIKANKGPVDKNVFDRGLVQEEPTSEEVIRECGTYYKNTSARLFDGPTLGMT